MNNLENRLNLIIRIQEASGFYHYQCETVSREIFITRVGYKKYIEIDNEKDGAGMSYVKNFKSEKAIRDYLSECIKEDIERGKSA